jgi:hemerythrin-like domain-containing protein
MDGIDVLISDHRRVEELFARLEGLQVRATGGEPALLFERKQLVDHVGGELSRHSVAEQTHVYPLVRRLLGDELAERELAEHREVEKTLVFLLDMSPDNVDFDAFLRRLIADVRAHIAEEEREILPRLRAELPPDELARLGRQITETESRAPTRPHPLAPHSGPLARVAAPAAAVLDRLRDRLTGRRQN